MGAMVSRTDDERVRVVGGDGNPRLMMDSDIGNCLFIAGVWKS
jgi:hypothetical protein